ncbi:hypothetical protein ACRQ1B_24130 [Rhizobium panacihumi]|uniref:hypothetical protein n=1 Tax=Rhizobium panacihumi TaxID=2008450 RepID=UPI003D7945E2
MQPFVAGKPGFKGGSLISRRLLKYSSVYFGTVREAVHKSSSACSAIHVISYVEGSGLVILLIMLVSRK